MGKLFIKNRKGQNIAVVIDAAPERKGLAFIAHGLGSSKDSPRIALMAGAFRKRGFTAVRYDTTNTFGESDGDYEHATVTNYYEDLEDVAEWAKSQDWYQEPFALAGSSLGGMCVILYAERHPERVRGLAPVAPVVSGALRVEARNAREPGSIERWKEKGFLEEEDEKRPGTVRKLLWSHIEDSMQYDTLADAEKLAMPVLLIVGADDPITPSGHVKKLFDAIPAGDKELHVVAGMGHAFKEQYFSEVEQLFLHWIDSRL